jgi:hypothetical protein
MSKKIALFSLLSILFAQLHSIDMPGYIITGFVGLTTGVFTYRLLDSYLEEVKLEQERWEKFTECLAEHGNGNSKSGRIKCYREYSKNFTDPGRIEGYREYLEPSLSN